MAHNELVEYIKNLFKGDKMSCFECGEYLTDPHQWVCDKCAEMFMKPFNKLSEEEKKKVLKIYDNFYGPF